MMSERLIKALFSVVSIIFTSPRKVIFLIYSRSYSIFFSQVTAFLPLIWASPLRPCRTVWRLRCSGVIKTMSRTSCGLGPITAMSPFKMLKSSGSSSRLVLRRNFPYAVRRTSSGSSFPEASRALVMVRNLTSLKIFSSLPGRGCVKNGFPFILNAPTTVSITSSGLRQQIAARAQKKSIGRLRKREYILIQYNKVFLKDPRLRGDDSTGSQG